MPRFHPSPDTFLVEEIPAYLPSGAGGHTFVWIEKRGITTLDAVGELARRLGLSPRDLGYAGMKDRHSTARQWLSLPGVTPEAALAGESGESGGGGVRVLRAERHGHKLRVGHVAANRFEVVVGDVDGAAGLAALGEGLARVAAAGLPNRYGEQRFGAAADNAARGLALLRGERRERDRRLRRLLLSATQAAVFNEVLALRRAEGSLATVLAGDVLQRRDSGGVFVTTEPDLDQRRLDAGELVITGPMPGGWAREPPPGTPARAIEERALAAVGVSGAAFAALGKDLPGTRRPLLTTVTLGTPPAEPGPDAGAARLRFTLPAGSYATVLLAEIGVTIG